MKGIKKYRKREGKAETGRDRERTDRERHRERREGRKEDSE